MGLLAWIILGAIAGWLASIFAGTDRSQGLVMNIVVGIVGAFLGGLIMSFFGKAGVTGFDLRSILVAALGAFVTLWIVRFASRTA